MEKLYQTHKTLTTMLHDRGYDVNNENQLTQSEFEKKYPKRENLSNLLYKGKSDSILVSYLIDTNKGGSIGIGPISKTIEYLKKNQLSHGLIIIPEKLSSKADEEIQNAKPDTRIEIFQETDLVFPIVQHRLVPKHTVLNNFQRKNLISRFRLNPSTLADQLPLLPTYDPICIYYDFKVGDIIRIDRPNGIYYRYVI